MTVSILNDILLLKEKEKIKDYLQSINLKIFNQIIKEYPDDYAYFIKYILCAYSEESPLIILRNDSKEEKESIADYLQIPEYLHGKLFQLSEPSIRHAATDYLIQFAGPVFKNYQFLKIQLADIDRDITNREFSLSKTDKEKVADGAQIVYTYEQKDHYVAMRESARLARQIEDLEKELKLQIKKMEGLTDMREWKEKKGKKTGSHRGIAMEHSPQIN